MRDRTVTVPVSAEEWERFELVAEHYEMPVHALLRYLVRREADWLRPGTTSSHGMRQHQRRDLIASERQRLGVVPDLDS